MYLDLNSRSGLRLLNYPGLGSRTQIRSKSDQNSIKVSRIQIRSKFDQIPIKVRPRFNQNSTKIRSKFGRNLFRLRLIKIGSSWDRHFMKIRSKFDKNSIKIGSKFDPKLTERGSGRTLVFADRRDTFSMLQV